MWSQRELANIDVDKPRTHARTRARARTLACITTQKPTRLELALLRQAGAQFALEQEALHPARISFWTDQPSFLLPWLTGCSLPRLSGL